MKYEISQGQYADFLNTLTTAQDSSRFPNSNGSNRHTIYGYAGSRTASAPNRACNFLSVMDGMAYADWAGLRMMTELEFEKACRGPTFDPEAQKYLKITGLNTQTAGSSQTITITVYNQNNNIDTSYVGDKILTFSGANESLNPAASPTCTNKDSSTVSFGTAAVITFSNGTATTSMKLYKGEAAAINVTDGIISTSDASYQLGVTVSPGTKNKLLWVTQPSSPVSAGVTWAPFAIQITDAYGNRTADTDNVTVIPSAQTFGGTTTKAAVSGLAAFNDITYNTVTTITVTGSSGSLTPTAASGGIVSTGSSPTVATGAATSILQTSATLNGTVNPNGSSTTYSFEYGTTTAYGTSSTSASAGSAGSNVSVNANISGLSANTTYHYRLFAQNSSGKVNGNDQTFTTISVIPPMITRGPALEITFNSAKLTGSINPNGGSTKYYFQYGISNFDYKTAEADIAPGTNNITVEKVINNLSSNTTYYFQIVATNSAGTSISSDKSFKTDPAVNQRNMKAIIVAGGGQFPGNNIWEATLKCANIAYRSLISQGITKDKIYYLNSENVDADGNGLFDDVKSDATNDYLEYAVTIWANDAQDLLLYLVDHGGDGKFMMRQGEDLTALQLDSWLDTIQNTIAGRVIVVYDACHSGSFIPILTAPYGKERIVVTSSSDNEAALFATNGDLSFSYLFWTNIMTGNKFYDSYVSAKNGMSLVGQRPNAMINISKDIAANIQIGNEFGTGSPPPLIGSVSPAKIISVNDSSALIYANVTAVEGIRRVWAVVTPPAFTTGSTLNPLTDLPSFDLIPIGGNDRYEAAYTGFTKKGLYSIVIFAIDQKGYMSQPMTTTVQVGGGGKTCFNGDGKTDLLWRNKGNGKVAVWLMNGTAISSYDITGTVEDLNWEIINTGDFDGDGKVDLLWRNKGNGKVAVWLMNGTAIKSYDIIGEVSDLNWEIINTGDFDGDGKADLLWRNKGNGKVAIWLMNGTAIKSYDIIGEVSDLNWEIINTGDFDGDGKVDLLWRNKGNGKVAIWLINGTAIKSYDIIGEVSDLNWEIINTGDFNRDGKVDLLWRNKGNGKVAVWLINGTAIKSYDIIGEVSDLNWEIINTGDFNGDGKVDLLWRNKGNGKVAVWLINGTAIQSYDIIGEVSDLNWEIINTGDFNGDGKVDLLWRNKGNGKVAVWLINGTAIQSYDIIGTVEDLNWEISNR